MKKEFTLKLNGKETVHVEAEGSDEIIEAFVKEVFTNSFGLFYKLTNEFRDIFLNGIRVQMKTIFTDMEGKEVKTADVVKELEIAGIPTPESAQISPPVKRGRGRPPGSPNRIKTYEH